MKKLIIFVFLFCAAGFLFAAENVKMTLAEFTTKRDANAAAFDEKYVGKKMEISGLVNSVEKQKKNFFIFLSSDKTFIGADAVVSATSQDALALKKGDSVAFLCTYQGLNDAVIPTPYFSRCVKI